MDPAREIPERVESVRVATPPYDSFPLARRIPAHRPPGTVLVVGLDVERFLRNPWDLIHDIWALRTRTLDSALVGRTARELRPLESTLLRRLGAAGLRAVVPPDFGARTLRRTLGLAGVVSPDLRHWLQARLSSEVPNPESVSLLLAPILTGHLPDDRTRNALQPILRRPLPTLHKWVMLGKLLPVLVRLQTEPGLSVMDAVREADYSESSSVSRVCKKNLFGMTVGEIRDRLGWEWLLERFLERKSR